MTGCSATRAPRSELHETCAAANPNRVEYAPVNVEVLGRYFDGDVTPDALYRHGLAHKGAKIKVLARGELDKKLTVKAHAFSKAAREKIEAAGGTAEVLS